MPALRQCNPAGHFDPGTGQTCRFCEEVEDLAKLEVLAAKDVTAPLCAEVGREQVPRRDVVHVDHVESGVEPARHTPVQEVEDRLSVGVGARSPGPRGNVGWTRTTGRPSAPARSTSCSATYFDCLYRPKRWAIRAHSVSSAMWSRSVPCRPIVPTVLVYTSLSTPAAVAALIMFKLPPTLTS